MGQLGITPDLVVETKFAAFTQAEVPEEESHGVLPKEKKLTPEERQKKKEERKAKAKEKKDAFVKDLKDKAKQMIQAKIDEAEALLTAVQTSATNTMGSIAGLTIMLSCIDPAAPQATKAILQAAAVQVKQVQISLATSTSQLSTITGIITSFGLPLPPPVTAATEAINAASSAINALPIP